MPHFTVYGGSFDPIHLGHISMIRRAVELGCRVVIVPAYRHAFGKQSAPFEHRLRMCRLALDASATSSRHAFATSNAAWPLMTANPSTPTTSSATSATACNSPSPFSLAPTSPPNGSAGTATPTSTGNSAASACPPPTRSAAATSGSGSGKAYGARFPRQDDYRAGGCTYCRRKNFIVNSDVTQP